jgi:hypothetical protein
MRLFDQGEIMQFKKEDKVLGVVATSLIRKKEGLCPADEEFALYIEGKLDKDRRKSIISHFVSCKKCKERLTIPALPLEATGKANNIIEKLLGFSWRPLVAAPVALAFVVLLALTLNVYLIQDGSEESYQEVYRDADLIALKQIDLTPSLLTTIKEGDKDRLKK